MMLGVKRRFTEPDSRCVHAFLQGCEYIDILCQCGSAAGSSEAVFLPYRPHPDQQCEGNERFLQVRRPAQDSGDPTSGQVAEDLCLGLNEIWKVRSDQLQGEPEHAYLTVLNV